MTRRIRECGEYAASCLTAVAMTGLVYVGMMYLNDAPLPESPQMVEGAIRLAQFIPEPRCAPLEKTMPRELEPPKRLPRLVASRSRTQAAAPNVAMRAPAFEVPVGPGSGPGLVVPDLNFGPAGFNIDEVDEAPKIVRSVAPDYPYAARRTRLEGRVVVRMLVTSEGVPTDLSIQSAEPPGVFNDVALKAAGRWRFRPGKYKGKAVDTWVLLPFDFELTS